jgi:hypothetical protein
MNNAIVTRIFKIPTQIAASFVPNQIMDIWTDSTHGIFKHVRGHNWKGVGSVVDGPHLQYMTGMPNCL